MDLSLLFAYARNKFSHEEAHTVSAVHYLRIKILFFNLHDVNKTVGGTKIP